MQVISKLYKKGMNNMSEEAKKAIEELVKVTENNDLAKAFLRGFKSGMETAGGAQAEESRKEESA